MIIQIMDTLIEVPDAYTCEFILVLKEKLMIQTNPSFTKRLFQEVRESMPL